MNSQNSLNMILKGSTFKEFFSELENVTCYEYIEKSHYKSILGGYSETCMQFDYEK